MPRTAEDVENYLITLGRNYEKSVGGGAGEGTFLLRTKDGPVVALQVAAPIVAIRVDIGQTPKDEKHELATYRRLLQLNSTDLMHASYGLEAGGTIVLSAALPLDNLDANELEATLSDIDVAIMRHIKELSHIARDTA